MKSRLRRIRGKWVRTRAPSIPFRFSPPVPKKRGAHAFLHSPVSSPPRFSSGLKTPLPFVASRPSFCPIRKSGKSGFPREAESVQ